jgi:hypothetical protein
MDSLNKLNDNFFINIKSYKNWFLIFTLCFVFIITSFLITLYSSFIFFEKQYFIIAPLLITTLMAIIAARQLIWILKGVIKVEINKTELVIQKNITTFSKYKCYYIEDIESVSIENLYYLKAINKLPFGSIHLSLITAFKRDSKSIVINYRQKEIEILDNLTNQDANLVLKKINYFLANKVVKKED